MNLAHKAVVLSAVLAFALGASAQATRTWISGVGDDANPCSRTAPCATWGGAIAKTASGGEVDALDPVNSPAVTITKPITLDGSGGTISSINGTASAITINVSAGTVTVRNMSLLSATSLFGVNINNATTVHLENVVTSGFINGVGALTASAGSPLYLTLDRVTARDGSNGLILGSGVSAVISNSSFLRNSNAGLSVTGGGSKVLVRNSVSASNNGAGFSAGGGAALTLTGVTATGNGGPGFFLDSSNGAVLLSLVNSTASNNTGAGLAATGNGSSIVRMTGTQLLSNTGGGLSVGTAALIGTYGDNVITNGLGGATLTNLAKQ